MNYLVKALATSPQVLRTIIVYGVVAILSLLIGRSASSDFQLIGVIALAGIVAAAFKFYRVTFLSIMFYMIIEGYIRRTYISSPAFILLKDFFLLLIYLRILLPALKLDALREIFPQHPAIRPLIALLVWGLLQVFNPASHVLVGLVGFKVWFFYLPLFFFSPLLLRDLKETKQFLFFLALTAIPVAAYGLYQIQTNAILSDLSPELAMSPDGTIMQRPRSTFYSTGPFQMYSHALLLFGTMLAFLNFKRKQQILICAAIFSATGALMISLARTAWIAVAFQVPIFLLMSGKVRFKNLFKIVAGSALLVTLLFYLFPTVQRYFLMRVETMSVNPYGVVVEDRGMSQLRHSVIYGLKGGVLFGHGLGTASPAARYIPSTYERPDAPGEGGLFKCLFEVGLIGFLCFAAFFFAILRETWREYRRSPPGEARTMLSLLFVYQLGYVFWFVKAPAFDEMFSASLFWLLSGAIFILRRRAPAAPAAAVRP